MKLEHSKIYLNGEGSKVSIRKEKWDCWFVGHSILNGAFMGYYTDDGRSIDGEPRLADLISEA
jgi:hypothetical protein